MNGYQERDGRVVKIAYSEDGQRYELSTTCAGKVYHDRFGFSPCAAMGKVVELGKPFCLTHSPSRVKARKEKREAKEREERQAADVRRFARQALDDRNARIIAAMEAAATGLLMDPAELAEALARAVQHNSREEFSRLWFLTDGAPS